jgi:hypothetical protein
LRLHPADAYKRDHCAQGPATALHRATVNCTVAGQGYDLPPGELWINQTATGHFQGGYDDA